MRTRTLILGFGALLALALFVPVSNLGPSLASARVGGRPPPFQLPAATGGPTSRQFRMSEHLGDDPVVILFWATWCQPCQQELPFYQAMYERYRERGLKIVAISMDSQATVMRAGPAARRLGVTFDVVTDLDTRVTTQLNPRRAAPFSIWVDRNGRITRESEGFSPAEQGALARGLAELVGN
ncbi:MAG: TlpA disulfide reductase family protein [Sandaracinaceae bacterium]|nr:MAG: TlpA family protein disulfide reductase [Sandaracinaceae bacterium]